MAIPKDEYDALSKMVRRYTTHLPKDKLDEFIKELYECMGGGDIGYLWRKTWNQIGVTLDTSKIDRPVLMRELNRIADKRGVPLAQIQQEFLDYGRRYIEETKEMNQISAAAKAAGMTESEYLTEWWRGLEYGKHGEA